MNVSQRAQVAIVLAIAAAVPGGHAADWKPEKNVELIVVLPD